MASVLVGTPDDTEGAFLGLLIKVRYPGFESTLRLIDAVPPALCRVCLHPRVGVSAGFGHGSSDGHGDAAEFRHVARRLPLRPPCDISVEPEAVLPLAHYRERFVELLVRDEIAAVYPFRGVVEGGTRNVRIRGA
jgi:hypothetical protein